MTTSETALVVIAVAALLMALAQIAVLIGALVFARRVNAAVERIEAATQPLLSRVDDVTAEALASMAAARHQMDRIEHLMTDVTERVDHTVQRLQAYVLKPAQQGYALLAGARAVMQVLRRPPLIR